MNVIVTGGAGFIGRWVVNKLLSDGHDVWALDNLSNGRLANITEFMNNKSFNFINGDIKNVHTLNDLFSKREFSVCYHLAASINVQDSLDDPVTTFNNDVVGTLNILEMCRRHKTKLVYMSTCMVYNKSDNDTGITEEHQVKPASPYAASKLAGENLVLSYWYGYGLPAVVLRPFNTYGPFQKTGGEGGVVAIFLKKNITNGVLGIYGDGCQTRDLLYVEDCADFIVKAGYSPETNGQIINAGLGRDICISDLAKLICKDETHIKHLPHIHPQSEIMKLLCNPSKANTVIGWKPKTSLEEGISRTEKWILDHMDLV